MYIDQWWGETIGSSEDSQELLQYFQQGHAAEYPLSRIFSDFNLYEQIQWGDLHQTDEIFFTDDEGERHEIIYGICLIADLAAITLESLYSGSVSVAELSDHCLNNPPRFLIQPETDEMDCMLEILSDFAKNPQSFDLAEDYPEDDLEDFAVHCGQIADELQNMLY